VTDPQDPPKPPLPAGGPTQQLAALVEDVPEDDGGEGADDGGEGGDASFDGAPPITTSKAPPLLPKEKKQVRNRAVIIGVLVFVVCTGLALGAIVMFGGLSHQPVAQPTPPPPPVVTPPTVAAGSGTAPTEHVHQPIRLDEFVFTAGTDAGVPVREAPPAPH
jgi:hypothetical protein